MRRPVLRFGAARAPQMLRFVLPALLLIAALGSVTPGGALDPDDVAAAVGARRALAAGEFDDAIRLYEIALAADPQARFGWYNYACALSRSGRKAAALTALENAMRVGYADSSWTASDPDLAALRDSAQFAALTVRMAVEERTAAAMTAQRLHAPQTRLSPYETELPGGFVAGTSARYPLILLLHGRGAVGSSMQRLARDLALEGVVFAWADAPYAIGGRSEGYEYWPAWARDSGQEAALEQAARLTAWSYAEIVRDLAQRLPIDTTRVFIVGFSQGAAMAYLTAMENPALFAGIAPLGGYVLSPYADSTRFSELARHGVALLIGHGSQDRSVALARAEEAAKMARAAGVDIELRIHPIGHTVSDEMIRELSAWLRARIGRESD